MPVCACNPSPERLREVGPKSLLEIHTNIKDEFLVGGALLTVMRWRMAEEYLDTCVHETHKCTKNTHSTLHTKKKIILTCNNGGGRWKRHCSRIKYLNTS